jgi:hypothetical protein
MMLPTALSNAEASFIMSALRRAARSASLIASVARICCTSSALVLNTSTVRAISPISSRRVSPGTS